MACECSLMGLHGRLSLSPISDCRHKWTTYGKPPCRLVFRPTNQASNAIINAERTAVISRLQRPCRPEGATYGKPPCRLVFRPTNQANNAIINAERVAVNWTIAAPMSD